MLDTQLVADTFNHEHQCRASEESAEVLASLASRIASLIEDPRERAAFVETASMSGLRIGVSDLRQMLLDMTAEEAEESILAMSEAEVEEAARAQASEILSRREGTPREHLDHCRVEDLMAAAMAESGQPCGDCGALVVWTDEAGWEHVEPSGCFLA